MSKCRPETTQEAEQYFFTIGGNSDQANWFYDYFESNGWKVAGRAAMKNWKAAARNWMRNANRFAKPVEYPGAHRTDSSISDADISRQARPGESWDAARVRLMRMQ